MTRNTKDITRQYLTHGHTSITTCVLCNSRESGPGTILLIEKWGLCQDSEDRQNLEIKRGSYTECVLAHATHRKQVRSGKRFHQLQ